MEFNQDGALTGTGDLTLTGQNDGSIRSPQNIYDGTFPSANVQGSSPRGSILGEGGIGSFGVMVRREQSRTSTRAAIGRALGISSTHFKWNEIKDLLQNPSVTGQFAHLPQSPSRTLGELTSHSSQLPPPPPSTSVVDGSARNTNEARRSASAQSSTSLNTLGYGSGGSNRLVSIRPQSRASSVFSADLTNFSVRTPSGLTFNSSQLPLPPSTSADYGSERNTNEARRSASAQSSLTEYSFASTSQNQVSGEASALDEGPSLDAIMKKLEDSINKDADYSGLLNEFLAVEPSNEHLKNLGIVTRYFINKEQYESAAQVCNHVSSPPNSPDLQKGRDEFNKLIGTALFGAQEKISSLITAGGSVKLSMFAQFFEFDTVQKIFDTHEAMISLLQIGVIPDDDPIPNLWAEFRSSVFEGPNIIEDYSGTNSEEVSSDPDQQRLFEEKGGISIFKYVSQQFTHYYTADVYGKGNIDYNELIKQQVRLINQLLIHRPTFKDSLIATSIASQSSLLLKTLFDLPENIDLDYVDRNTAAAAVDEGVELQTSHTSGNVQSYAVEFHNKTQVGRAGSVADGIKTAFEKKSFREGYKTAKKELSTGQRDSLKATLSFDEVSNAYTLSIPNTLDRDSRDSSDLSITFKTLPIDILKQLINGQPLNMVNVALAILNSPKSFEIVSTDNFGTLFGGLNKTDVYLLKGIELNPETYLTQLDKLISKIYPSETDTSLSDQDIIQRLNEGQSSDFPNTLECVSSLLKMKYGAIIKHLLEAAKHLKEEDKANLLTRLGIEQPGDTSFNELIKQLLNNFTEKNQFKNVNQTLTEIRNALDTSAAVQIQRTYREYGSRQKEAQKKSKENLTKLFSNKAANDVSFERSKKKVVTTNDRPKELQLRSVNHALQALLTDLSASFKPAGGIKSIQSNPTSESLQIYLDYLEPFKSGRSDEEAKIVGKLPGDVLISELTPEVIETLNQLPFCPDHLAEGITLNNVLSAIREHVLMAANDANQRRGSEDVSGFDPANDEDPDGDGSSRSGRAKQFGWNSYGTFDSQNNGSGNLGASIGAGSHAGDGSDYKDHGSNAAEISQDHIDSSFKDTLDSENPETTDSESLQTNSRVSFVSSNLNSSISSSSLSDVSTKDGQASVEQRKKECRSNSPKKHVKCFQKLEVCHTTRINLQKHRAIVS